jgi:hypothetical protein
MGEDYCDFREEVCPYKEASTPLHNKIRELEQKLKNAQDVMQENIETKWIKSPDAYLGQECVIDSDWFNRWIAKMNNALKGN